MSIPSKQKQSSRAKATPMMRQYTAIKEQNPGTVLLYRMGDFYEMFNEDAKIASRVLGLTLTSRNHGGTENTPLAGFPHHALDRYANRLVRAGYKIAVCEQTEDPKTAKGVVKRDVIEVITAGTATEDNFIDEKRNNFIMAAVAANGEAGVAIADLSTGEFSVEEVPVSRLEEEIVRLEPAEMLVAQGENSGIEGMVTENFRQVYLSKYDPWKFTSEHGDEVLKTHFGIASLDGLGLEGFSLGIGAAGALMSYLKEQKKNDLRHITGVTPRALSEFAELDPASIRNLEILRPMHGDDTHGTLVAVLDHTSTAMGARLLKRWLTHPLKSIAAVNARLDGVAWLRSDVFVRGEMVVLLKGVADIERLIGRITFERASARDLVSLKESLRAFPRIRKALETGSAKLLERIGEALDGFEDIAARIDGTLVDSPPLSVREGGLVRPGVSAELDELKDASKNGKQWIARLQETERARTGISSLKVGYNKVFGYYIEVSKSNLAAVPGNYVRKQTLVNGERYVTEELKDMEAKVLGAEERLSDLEYSVFVKLRAEIAQSCGPIQKAAEAIATLDCLVSLSVAAAEYGYTRPVLQEGTEFAVHDGRHPVVERMSETEQFVPNDTAMDAEANQILLITGPNMAGKSTYLRQNALIAIMAQMGSFVPAASAHIGVIDRFFTRVGASDRLARGQSTFLVEMIEVANILNNATDRSLVLLDEVGRGTSTFDGISIAWAVAEFLHQAEGRRARTLFATHYHELTELALLFPRIKNLHIRVKEWNDRIIFLRTIGDGSCDHSYGIQVARLAGVPREVIIRAKEILANLENMELTPDHKPVLARHHDDRRRDERPGQTSLLDGVQMNLLDTTGGEIVEQLRALDINGLTPLDALNILAEMKKKAE
ncbi:MAG: DNA mismatch repair protein MutS [Chitinivibrionales bacterium]|nr:DNA mismatch repair protein MutS [Chitinivibrionales bacterium]MBD3394680.1 DNA mismatch repair protein MutS [Chitinivibrionales bacterium]